MSIPEIEKLAKHLLDDKEIEEYIREYISSRILNKKKYERIMCIKDCLYELSKVIPNLTESFEENGFSLRLYSNDNDMLYEIKNWRDE